MLQEILTRTLKKSHRNAGLYLDEDEDFVYLKKDDKILAVFSAVGATIESVWMEADKYSDTGIPGNNTTQIVS